MAAKTTRRKNAAPAPVGMPARPAPASQSDDTAVRMGRAADMIARAKEMLELADREIDILVKTVGVGRTVQIDKTRVGLLVDQFAEANQVWSSHCNKRYILKIIKLSQG